MRKTSLGFQIQRIQVKTDWLQSVKSLEPVGLVEAYRIGIFPWMQKWTIVRISGVGSHPIQEWSYIPKN